MSPPSLAAATSASGSSLSSFSLSVCADVVCEKKTSKSKNEIEDMIRMDLSSVNRRFIL